MKTLNLKFSWIFFLAFIIGACGGPATESTEEDASAEREASTEEVVALNILTQGEIDAGWVLLFDGETSGGWRSYVAAVAAQRYRSVWSHSPICCPVKNRDVRLLSRFLIRSGAICRAHNSTQLLVVFTNSPGKEIWAMRCRPSGFSRTFGTNCLSRTRGVCYVNRSQKPVEIGRGADGCVAVFINIKHGKRRTGPID